MRLRHLLAAALVLLPTAAFAQATIQLSGASLVDTNGNPFNGRVTFTVVNASGVPQTYTPQGGSATTATFTDTVVNGVVQPLAGVPFTIVNTLTASPTGLQFHYQKQNTAGTITYFDDPHVGLTSTTGGFSLDAYTTIAGTTVSGIGPPRNGCSATAIYNQTDAVTGAKPWICSVLYRGDGSTQWTQNPSANQQCGYGQAIVQPRTGAGYCVLPEAAYGLPNEGLVNTQAAGGIPGPVKMGPLSGSGGSVQVSGNPPVPLTPTHIPVASAGMTLIDSGLTESPGVNLLIPDPEVSINGGAGQLDINTLLFNNLGTIKFSASLWAQVLASGAGKQLTFLDPITGGDTRVNFDAITAVSGVQIGSPSVFSTLNFQNVTVGPGPYSVGVQDQLYLGHGQTGDFAKFTPTSVVFPSAFGGTAGCVQTDTNGLLSAAACGAGGGLSLPATNNVLANAAGVVAQLPEEGTSTTAGVTSKAWNEDYSKGEFDVRNPKYAGGLFGATPQAAFQAVSDAMVCYQSINGKRATLRLPAGSYNIGTATKPTLQFPAGGNYFGAGDTLNGIGTLLQATYNNYNAVQWNTGLSAICSDGASHTSNLSAGTYHGIGEIGCGTGTCPNAPVLAPPGLAATGSTTGGTLAAATYFYKVTAVGVGGGETNSIKEVSVTTTGTTSSVALSWNGVQGAASYKVYRGTTAGGESVFYSVTSPTVTYTDTNAASTAGTVPTSNTGVDNTSYPNGGPNQGGIFIGDSQASSSYMSGQNNGSFNYHIEGTDSRALHTWSYAGNEWLNFGHNNAGQPAITSATVAHGDVEIEGVDAQADFIETYGYLNNMGTEYGKVFAVDMGSGASSISHLFLQFPQIGINRNSGNGGGGRISDVRIDAPRGTGIVASAGDFYSNVYINNACSDPNSVNFNLSGVGANHCDYIEDNGNNSWVNVGGGFGSFYGANSYATGFFFPVNGVVPTDIPNILQSKINSAGTGRIWDFPNTFTRGQGASHYRTFADGGTTSGGLVSGATPSVDGRNGIAFSDTVANAVTGVTGAWEGQEFNVINNNANVTLKSVANGGHWHNCNGGDLNLNGSGGVLHYVVESGTIYSGVGELYEECDPAPAGSGGTGTVSGVTGEYGLFSGATAIGTGNIDDGLTTAGVITAGKPFAVIDASGFGGGTRDQAGTVPTGAVFGPAAGFGIHWFDTTAQRYKMNPNNTGALLIPGIAAAGTSGHLAVLAANGIDIQDGGVVPTSGGTNAFAPTIGNDAGAGTSPTSSLTAGSNDDAGWVNLTEGTSPTASVGIITVTFGGTYSGVRKCIVEGSNAAAAALSGTAKVFSPSGTSTALKFDIFGGATTLTAGTVYQFAYRCTN